MAKHPIDPSGARAVPDVNDRTDLACKDPDVDPDWFFSNSTLARPVCMACKARMACLEWALATDQRHGMWGGLTAEERLPLLEPAS